MERGDHSVRGGMPERPKGADCKSAGSRLRRFESFSLHHTEEMRGNSSAGRASAFQAECHGFESRFPLHTDDERNAHIAQSAEHFLGKEEVTSSILVVGSKRGAEKR
jgi:hypothetical protein